MAKRKSGSSYTYFKELLPNHPDWVEQRSNKPILDQYRTDHGLGADAKIPTKVMNNLANVKSSLRSGTHKTKRRKAKAEGVKVVAPVNKLDALEIRIDDCLTMARHLESRQLEGVIELLRQARNRVVMIGG
jgi:hypothetical protein